MQLPRQITGMLVSVLIPAAVFLTKAAAGQEPGYVFTVNGRDVEPPIYAVEGSPGEPRPGDVVVIEGALLILGEERS